MTVWTEATSYTVCAVPETVRDWDIFAIRVERTEPGLYAVRWRSRCLNGASEWVYEPIPSERTVDFKARCRFDLATALEMAERIAPALRCNNITAARAAVEWAKETA